MKLTLLVLEGFLIESHRFHDVIFWIREDEKGGGGRESEREREDESLPH